MQQAVKTRAKKRKPPEIENLLTLTPRETTALTRFGINRTYELLRDGRMPSIQVGKRFFVPKSALLKWLEDAGR
jgi:excisionase family DNA binding protein